MASAIPLLSAPPQPAGKFPCWYHLAIALIITSNAFAIVFIVRDGFSIGNNAYVDHLIEQCGSEAGIPADRYFDQSICHYTRLWLRLGGGSNSNAVNDLHCFIHTLLMAILVACVHYVVASLILLIGGFIRSNHLAFLPWLVFKMALILLTVALIVAETAVYAPLTQAALILYLLLAFSSLTMLTVTVSCVLIKQKREMEQAVVKFDYFRF